MQPLRRILFLGNPYFLEDKIALIIGEMLKDRLEAIGFDVIVTFRTSLGILDYLIDVDEIIIVDSLLSIDCRKGEVLKIHLDSLRASIGLGSHALSLNEVVELAKQMPDFRVKHIKIIGICISDDKTISEDLSEDLKAAINDIAERVYKLILE